MAADEAEQSLLHEYELSEGKAPRADSPARPRTPRLLSLAALLLLLVSVTDVLALAFAAHAFRTHYAAQDFRALPFANPYVGLDALYASGLANASRLAPFARKPRVSAPLFPAEPARVAPAGAHDRWYPAFGTFATNERHLHVDARTHTLLQFRTIDFGMEDCALVLRLPARGAPLDVADATPFLFRAPSALDVWALDAEAPLDPRTLSFANKPRTRELFASVEARPGEETVVKRFPCPWGSLLTFEVACAQGTDCQVDVWSTQNNTWGMYIMQHQTI